MLPGNRQSLGSAVFQSLFCLFCFFFCFVFLLVLLVLFKITSFFKKHVFYAQFLETLPLFLPRFRGQTIPSKLRNTTHSGSSPPPPCALKPLPHASPGRPLTKRARALEGRSYTATGGEGGPSKTHFGPDPTSGGSHFLLGRHEKQPR